MVKALSWAGLLLCLALAGCDRDALVAKWVPSDDDRIARAFIEDLREGRAEDALGRMDVPQRADQGQAALQEAATAQKGGELRSIHVIEAMSEANLAGKKTVTLGYEVEVSTGWFLERFRFDTADGVTRLVGFRVVRLRSSMEQINDFSPWRRGAAGFLFAALCVAVPAFCLATAVACFRLRPRRRWLWMLFVLVGVCPLSLNWTTAHLALHPFSVLLLGASAEREGLYGPWELACAVPLGAILFWVYRRRLAEARDKASSRQATGAPGSSSADGPSSGSGVSGAGEA